MIFSFLSKSTQKVCIKAVLVYILNIRVFNTLKNSSTAVPLVWNLNIYFIIKTTCVLQTYFFSTKNYIRYALVFNQLFKSNLKLSKTYNSNIIQLTQNNLNT